MIPAAQGLEGQAQFEVPRPKRLLHVIPALEFSGRGETGRRLTGAPHSEEAEAVTRRREFGQAGAFQGFPEADFHCHKAPKVLPPVATGQENRQPAHEPRFAARQSLWATDREAARLKGAERFGAGGRVVEQAAANEVLVAQARGDLGDRSARDQCERRHAGVFAQQVTGQRLEVRQAARVLAHEGAQHLGDVQ